MKLYIIAGEASGDLHGSNLIKALKARQPEMECRVWGGDLMAAAGGVLVKHYRDLAFMGFVEVLKNLRTILRNMAFCKADISAFKPDALVFIDYPGFNLRIAKWARKKGFRTIYYISPQVWAWHRSRVYDIKRDIDRMLVILPFERDFYQQYGISAVFTGHPLLDVIQQPVSAEDHHASSDIIALLPGSRMQEIRRILPPMLGAAALFPQYRFMIAPAPGIDPAVFTPWLGSVENVSLYQGDTYELLRMARAALVKSGTSTLETALHGVPEVVCYAGNPVSYYIARRLVDIKYISLVNLILDKPAVTELIQHALTPQAIANALAPLLEGPSRMQMRADFAALREKLGKDGASRNAAEAIITYLEDV